MQPDDLSSADLGDGFTLKFQEAKSIVRAVVKDASGMVVVTGMQVPKSEAHRSRFDAMSQFLKLRTPEPVQTDFDDEDLDEDFDDEEEEEDEEEDDDYL